MLFLATLCRVSWFSSECDGCCSQCRVPDHVDSVSQKTAQTLQTAPETHHGISVESQRRPRSEVRVHRFPLWCLISVLGLHFSVLVTSFWFVSHSPLLVFLKDQASSHLIDTIMQLAHKSLLRDLYKDHLKGQLVDLALHPIANFPIQRLTAASAKCKLVGSAAPCWPRDAGSDCRQYLSLCLSLSEVPEVVWWAAPRFGGHLGSRSHGSDRPAGRELRGEWGEAGGCDAVPAPRKHKSLLWKKFRRKHRAAVLKIPLLDIGLN